MTPSLIFEVSLVLLILIHTSLGSEVCPPPKPMLAPRSRWHLTLLLQEEGLKTGVELGIKTAGFTEITLNNWPGCTRYYMVDIWRHQKNYKDGANKKDKMQEKFYREAVHKVERWKDKVVILRNYTADAVKLIPGPVDYVYVDARHDYCGVSDDIKAYWPLVRPGGIIAGHDYMTAAEAKEHLKGRGEDWALCANGTRHPGSVAAAVDDFAREQQVNLFVTWGDPPWLSWVIRKPFPCHTAI